MSNNTTLPNPAMELLHLWISQNEDTGKFTKENLLKTYKFFHEGTKDLLMEQLDILIDKTMPKIIELLK